MKNKNFNANVLQKLGFSNSAAKILAKYNKMTLPSLEAINTLKIHSNIIQNIHDNWYKLLSYSEYEEEILNILDILKGKSFNDAKYILCLVQRKLEEKVGNFKI